jgi:hypothetical protein
MNIASGGMNQQGMFGPPQTVATGQPGIYQAQPAAVPVPVSQSTIDKLKTYISNLKGDPTRTAEQNKELATYQARLTEYQSRGVTP